VDDAALALLHALCAPHGIHASLSSVANYRAIFARDAIMAGIAGLLLEDDVITAGLVRTLEQLRDLQGSEGQIASNFEMREGAPPNVSFGTLAPRIDAATWYLLGVALGARAGALNPDAFRASVEKVVRCLDALEYNGRHLVYIPTGGNWADEYIYEGYILYDQVLRGWGLRLTGEIFDRSSWIDKAARIGETIATRYAPRDAGAPYPIAAFSPIRSSDVFDLAATALLALSGLAPSLADPALAWVTANFVARGALPPAFHPVIEEGDPDWPALRRYHLHEFRNTPHEYHNGGIWPIWLGWLALALAATDRVEALEALRQSVSETLASSDSFAFEEFFHGRTRRPGGTTRMAYSATGLVFLRLAGTTRQMQLLAP
jgi:hypothetical protein